MLLLVPSGSQPGGTVPTPASWSRPGPLRVVTSQVEAAGGDRFAVFAPASYAAVGFPSPIVTWGDGTNTSPDDYGTLLSHLASWGFTVIASTVPDTGSGRLILAGARYLVAADRRPGTRFHGHLDTHEVAVMGQSQGATGAVRAAEVGGSFIATVVTFSLPWNGQGPVGTVWDAPGFLGWAGSNASCATALDCWADPLDLHQPTFLVATGGPLDALIANPGVERCYFEEVHAAAALGVVEDSGGQPADHSSIMDSDAGGNPQGMLGYVTAWLLDHLRHDSAATAAFSGRHPSLLRDPDWSGSAVKAGWSGDRGCG